MVILVTGAAGMIGKNLINRKQSTYDAHGLNSPYIFITREECDLLSFPSVNFMFNRYRPTHVYHLASVVGGVYFNKDNNTDILCKNSIINTHIIMACIKYGCKLVAILSTCIFPKQYMEFTMADIHNGIPHETNIGYAYSKRMLQIACDLNGWNYLIPSNIYGPHDNFDVFDGHLIPSFIHKIYLSSLHNIQINVSGNVLRQFVYVDDVIDALTNIHNSGNAMIVGEEVAIYDVINLIANIMNYNQQIIYNDDIVGIRQKKGINCLVGQTPLRIGIEKTITWFIQNYPNVRFNSQNTAKFIS